MNTEVIKLSLDDPDFSDKINKAADVIIRGGLVVFPTETVYGLGADATNPEAARKIFEAKGRPSDNPLIIHLAEPGEAENYTVTNDIYYKLSERFMPGPLTVVLPSKETVPKATRGGLDTVAVRCPENEIARAIIRASGRPIAAPSANLSGTPSPTNAAHVIDDMYGRVDVIIDGGSADFGLESTIVKIDSDGGVTLLRPGKITVEDLREVCGKVNIADAVTDKLKEGEIAISPGMKYKHYAPKAPLTLLEGEIEDICDYISKNSAENVAVIAYEDDIPHLESKISFARIYSFGKKDDEWTQAHNLFNILREADKENFEQIYAPLPRMSGVGLALYNRMIRAAAHKIVKL